MRRQEEQRTEAITKRDRRVTEHPPELWTALVITPLLATAFFYLLPAHAQAQRSWQFLPQRSAYACLTLWAVRNRDIPAKLGLEYGKISTGIWKGLGVGLILGSLNTVLILYGAPLLDIEIGFLRETPHAHLSPALMVPWFILLIAIGVEVNFRGFLLGRFTALLTTCPVFAQRPFVAQALALSLSSLIFAFDPFMVVTFQSLHWIALWDGLIWGGIWLYTRNLYIPITAHAMEVIIEYLTIRSLLI